jgi:hypothetical protein
MRVMFAGHCDQIGLLVTQIDEQRIHLFAADRRLGSSAVDWPADGDLDGQRSGARRNRPQADPSVDGGGAQAGRQAAGSVARHRRPRQAGRGRIGADRRPGHVAAWVSGDAERLGERSSDGQQNGAMGCDGGTALARNCAASAALCMPFRRCKRKSVVRRRNQPPSVSIRMSGSRSM